MCRIKEGGRLCVLLLTAALVFLPQASLADDSPRELWQIWTSAESVSYSEPVTVYSTFHDLEGGFNRGDEAFTYNRFAVGLSRGAFSIGFLARYDYHVQADPDTAELMHAGGNDLSLDLDRVYTIRGSVNHIRSNGIVLGYRFQPIRRVDLNVELSLLRANQLLEGDIAGTIATVENETYSGQARVSYSYSEDLLLHRKVSEPTGYGYAFDAHLVWHITDTIDLAVSVEDWMHAIQWDDAPFTRADVTSATVSFDENGFIETTPILSGVEGEHNLRQQLPVRTDVEITYKFRPRMEVSVAAFNVDSVTLPRLGFTWQASAERQWQFGYGAKDKALTVGVTHRNFRVFLGSDRIDYREARYLSFGVSYLQRW